VTIDDESGILRWIKQELKPLPHRIDEETGCTTNFCGDCECACVCLCIAIRDAVTTEGITHTSAGKICDTSYGTCDVPAWSGTVANPLAGTTYDFDLTLARDAYGQCVLTGTIGADDVGEIAIINCGAINIEYTDQLGVVFTLRCKSCDDCEEKSLCCGGRDITGALKLSVLNTMATCGTPQGPITLVPQGGGVWLSNPFVVTVPVPDGGGESCEGITMSFRLFCDPGGPIYQLQMKFTYLGTTYPATGWDTQFKVAEDCEYPYSGLWDHNGHTAWNGVLSYFLEES